MTETQISITVNRKNDIDLIKNIIIDSKFQFPIYILEFEFHYQIRFESECEEWELDTKITQHFPEFEFKTDLDKGRKEIRLQISRNQSSLATDSWGRPLEDPLNETKYLVRKSSAKPERFNPNVQVLFNEDMQDYYINIIEAIRKQTGERGYLILDDFKSENEDFEKAIKDTLYQSPYEAFEFGYYALQNVVSQDFEQYSAFRKKEQTKVNKIPRKIVREFLDACNKSDLEGVKKHLHEDVVFIKRIWHETKVNLEGLDGVMSYFASENSTLFGRDFKIRSNWFIRLPLIEIGLKYYPTTQDNSALQYKKISFEIVEGQITRIIENQ